MSAENLELKTDTGSLVMKEHFLSTERSEIKNADEDTDSVFKKIKELSVSILDSITKDHIENFTFFNKRHYEDYYFVNCNKQGHNDDMCIRVHTNKLLLLSLANGNDIIKTGKNITEIDFIINKGKDY